MPIQPEDIRTQLRSMREDLTRLQGRVTDALNMLNNLGLPEQGISYRCPTCNVPLRGPLSLAEHIHLSHDGPLPAHYLEAERLAGLT